MTKQPPVFSLISCTKGRTEELDKLLQSVADQQCTALELILVDQNEDDRLEPVVSKWSSRVAIQWLRHEPGLSRSRNAGLRCATGSFLAFPDDDCWYSPLLLENVERWFGTHPEYTVLTVGALDEHGAQSGNRWIRSECDINAVNAFRTTFSSTIFLRRTEQTAGTRFDEGLGVGSRTASGCGEETDYILRVLGTKGRGFFTRKWHIGHPKRDMLSGEVHAGRAASYGHGMGHVLRMHKLYGIWLVFVAYDLLRATACYLRGKKSAAELCLHHAAGLFRGGLHPVPSEAKV